MHACFFNNTTANYSGRKSEISQQPNWAKNEKIIEYFNSRTSNTSDQFFLKIQRRKNMHSRIISGQFSKFYLDNTKVVKYIETNYSKTSSVSRTPSNYIIKFNLPKKPIRMSIKPLFTKHIVVIILEGYSVLYHKNGEVILDCHISNPYLPTTYFQPTRALMSMIIRFINYFCLPQPILTPSLSSINTLHFSYIYESISLHMAP